MICSKCRHDWEYKGKSHSPTCPICKFKNNVSDIYNKNFHSNKSVFAEESGLNDKEYYNSKLVVAIANNDSFMIYYYNTKLNDC